MSAPAVFVLLFAVATAVALAVRALKVPYTVALVLAGLALGATRAIPAPHLTEELLYSVFLPGLLFEAAFHLKARLYWQNKLALHALALPGVALATVGTAGILAVAAPVGLGWGAALAFGALTAATDPIAVVALFKSLRTPKRLALLVEGESLLNDGTAVVLTAIVVRYAVGEPVTLAGAAVDFVRIAGGGALLGASLALALSQISKRVDDPLIEITLTTIAAYGSFVAAEQLHLSGVMATVAAGIAMGSHAAPRVMSTRTVASVEAFWEYVAFAFNSIVFLLIGFEVRVGELLRAAAPVGIAYAAIVVVRAIVVGVVTMALSRTPEQIPWRWSVLVTWGGLRGALSMVLALALPPAFPQRQLLVTMTFGVVILSLLVNGLTIAPLLRWLGVARSDANDARPSA